MSTTQEKLEACIRELSYKGYDSTLSDLLDESLGATVLSIEGPKEYRDLLQSELLKESDSGMQEAPRVVYIHQLFSQKRVFKNEALLHLLTRKIEQEIKKEIYHKHSLTPSKQLFFDDIIMQKYDYVETASAFAIPPHVDYKACVELIAILLVTGDSQFFVAEDRECNRERHIEAKPLDIILMRGYGFQGREKRPIHYIKKIKEGEVRVSLGFRMLGDNEEDIRTMEKALRSP